MCLVDIICGVRLLWSWQKQTSGQWGKWKEIFQFRINMMLNTCIWVSIVFFFSWCFVLHFLLWFVIFTLQQCERWLSSNFYANGPIESSNDGRRDSCLVFYFSTFEDVFVTWLDRIFTFRMFYFQFERIVEIPEVVYFTSVKDTGSIQNTGSYLCLPTSA